MMGRKPVVTNGCRAGRVSGAARLRFLQIMLHGLFAQAGFKFSNNVKFLEFLPR